MANQATMAGDWSTLKSRIRSKWGQMTDEVLDQCKGSTDVLINTIQRMTGETREVVERYLTAWASQSADAYNRASAAVRTGAAQVAAGAQQVGSSIRDAADQSGKLVKARPFESLMIVFGAGIVTGLVAGMLMRSGD